MTKGSKKQKKFGILTKLTKIAVKIIKINKNMFNFFKKIGLLLKNFHFFLKKTIFKMSIRPPNGQIHQQKKFPNKIKRNKRTKEGKK